MPIQVCKSQYVGTFVSVASGKLSSKECEIWPSTNQKAGVFPDGGQDIAGRRGDAIPFPHHLQRAAQSFPSTSRAHSEVMYAICAGGECIL